MIDSHQGWDRHVPSPRGGGRHAEEIADLWRAYAKCESLQAKKCNQKNPNSCLQPEIETSSVSTGEMIAGSVLVTAGVIAFVFGGEVVAAVAAVTVLTTSAATP